MTSCRTIGFALLALASAAGCTQKVALGPRPACDFTPMLTAAPATGQHLVPPVAGTMTPMPLNTVNITDIGITNKVLVQAVSARRTEAGTVEVWSRLVNCTDFPLQLEGRTHFMDSNQAPVEPVSAWQRVFLGPRSMGVYTERSTQTKRARSYLIEIREGT